MCRYGLSWNLVIFHPCNNLSKFLTMRWNSMCTWIQYHIIDHSPTYQHWKLFYTKGFCKSSVTDIMKACTEDSKLLVQTRCFLAGSLYLLENLSARQFFHCWHMLNCAHPWSAMTLCSSPEPTVSCCSSYVALLLVTLFLVMFEKIHSWVTTWVFFKMCVKLVVFLYEFSFFYSFNVSFLGNTWSSQLIYKSLSDSSNLVMLNI